MYISVFFPPTPVPCRHLITMYRSPFLLRLCAQLETIKKAMEVSYAELAKYVTEIKMDYDMGKKLCPELTEFLD